MPKKEKKEKKRPVDDEELGAGDLPEEDVGAKERAEERKKKKKQKKVVEDEPPVEQESEPEDDVLEEEAAKKRLTKSRKKKKLTGYRLKAQECGFLKNAGISGAGGEDMLASAITTADATRLMRFVPEVLNKSSYDKTECAARMLLSTVSVPQSAARVTSAYCEAAMRKFAKDALMLTLEKGVSTINADTMMSVLRPYQYNMSFSAVLPPKGLIRHAQTNAVLGASAADEENLDQEKEENRELSAAQRKIDAAEIARKEAFRKRRDEIKSAREVAA